MCAAVNWTIEQGQFAEPQLGDTKNCKHDAASLVWFGQEFPAKLTEISRRLTGRVGSGGPV